VIEGIQQSRWASNFFEINFRVLSFLRWIWFWGFGFVFDLASCISFCDCYLFTELNGFVISMLVLSHHFQIFFYNLWSPFITTHATSIAPPFKNFDTYQFNYATWVLWERRLFNLNGKDQIESLLKIKGLNWPNRALV